MKKKTYGLPNIRRGKFLWMDSDEQNVFISTLKCRIENGYYFSEKVITKIADELSPVLSELTGD